MGSSTSPQQPRYGWMDCAACGGSGVTRKFQGNSTTILHLARGGNPAQLPCGECRGNRRVWSQLPERQADR